MTPFARLQAVIDIITDAENRKRPAVIELKDWQRDHRYAGSKDRAALFNMIQDCYRWRASTTAMMLNSSPRALVLGTAVRKWDMSAESMKTGFEAQKYAPEPLEDDEFEALNGLAAASLKDLTPAQQAEVPDWIFEKLSANFDTEAIVEGQALATRAPVDVRVNILKTTREKMLPRFEDESATMTALSPHGIRFPAPSGMKGPAQPAQSAEFKRGQIDIQDEGSQIVSKLIYAQPGEKILDYCAGGGGKSLAMSAAMGNKGQIFAYDNSKARLSECVDRIKRAGAHNIQLRMPKEGVLDDLLGKMDRVVVDAPCTGSGTWRRRPDLKWRMTPNALADRINDQAEILNEAKAFPKIDGFLIYITCSMFADENETQIANFVSENPNFELVSCQEVWEEFFAHSSLQPWSSDGMTVTLTPASTQTDGFFFAVLQRMA